MASLLAWPASAAAQEVSKQACVEGHLRAQSQRIGGELVEAQENLRLCASKDCPEIVQRDCVKWLEELEGQVPTVIFEAFDEQGALRDVRVTRDGQVVAGRLDGTALEINPGTYDFVFQMSDGRRRIQRVLVREADRNRHIGADFTVTHDDEDPVAGWTWHVPPLAQALGGVTVAATAVAVGFGASALIRQSNAIESCAPECSASVSHRIATRAAVADLAAGVALGAGVTTIVLVARASRERPPAAGRVAPVVGVSSQFGFLGFRGAF